ncbi:MAG: hypothetical protein WC732_03705 [Candidatus Omnitrophota bacterium]
METPLEKNEQEKPGAEPVAAAAGKTFLARMRTDRTVWMFVILAVFGFFLAAAIFAFVAGRKKQPAAVKPPASKPVAKSNAAVPAPPKPAPVVSSASAPEVPVYAGTPPALVLSGILFSEEGSLALIDGKVVPEGGTVAGATVERIGSDEVELSYEGQTFILRSR